MYKQIPPVFYRTSSPLRPLPKNVVSNSLPGFNGLPRMRSTLFISDGFVPHWGQTWVPQSNMAQRTFPSTIPHVLTVLTRTSVSSPFSRFIFGSKTYELNYLMRSRISLSESVSPSIGPLRLCKKVENSFLDSFQPQTCHALSQMLFKMR